MGEHVFPVGARYENMKGEPWDVGRFDGSACRTAAPRYAPPCLATPGSTFLASSTT